MDFLDVLEFERTLAKGSWVHVRWSNCGNFYAADAVVDHINRSSIVVILESAPAGYQTGARIRVPRAIDKRWSPNNSVDRRTQPKVKEFLCRTRTSIARTPNAASRGSSSPSSAALLF